MFFKALFKDSSAFVQILMLVAVIGFCIILLLAATIVFVLVKFGFSPNNLLTLQDTMNANPDMLRGLQFIQGLLLFVLPAIICAYLFSNNYREYLRTDTPIQIPTAVWTIVCSLAVIPFLNLTYHYNQQMVFPEALKGLETWMQDKEALAAQLTEKMLAGTGPGVIVFNVVTICVLAAVGEEFLFRGVLQNLFGRVLRSPHTVIWVVAVVFSAFHFQFYGFVTRLLLGAYLGYLLYYTKTIWIPVLAHFTNNFFSVVMYYVFQDAPQKTQEVDTVGTGSTWWLAVASLALFVFGFSQIRKKTKPMVVNL